MIRIKELTFGYTNRRVLENVSLDIGQGLTSIVGPNAAGKSTLMKCIFGLLNYEGEILLKNKAYGEYSKSEINDLLVYLPQEEGYTPRLTVLETVLLGRLQTLSWNVSEEEIEGIEDILKMLSIDNLSTRYLTELSGGQRQMVYIAQTIARNPEILLLDEPTNNLDIQKQLEFCHLLRLIIEEKTMSILVVFHDLNLAIKYSDNIIVIDGKGGIYSHGSPKDVITESMLRDVYGIEAEVNMDSLGDPVVVAKKSIRDIRLNNKIGHDVIHKPVSGLKEF